MQILTPQPAADALEEGHGYLPDREVSDVDDPDLGAAAMEEDDATDGGGGAGGFGGGGGLDEWPDDDGEEVEPLRLPGINKAGASSSAVPAAPGGARKRRAGPSQFGSRPKKPKSTAGVTRREEAAAKAVRFQKATKQPPMVSS